jgi:hypothetical protein
MGGYRSVTLGIAAAAAAAILTACGGPGTGSAAPASAAGLVTQMKAAVRGASSMHVAGQLTQAGQPFGVDLAMLRAGEFDGTLTSRGVPIQLTKSAGQVYVRATPAFLRELKASSVCPVLCGKYVQMNRTEASTLSRSLSMTSVTNSLLSSLPSFRRAGTATVNGQPAIVLHGSDGSTLDVAARGRPYPLRASAPAGQPEHLVFSRWNAVPAPAPPPRGDVLNLGQLKAGAS